MRATSTQTDTKYYKVKKLTIKDKATVWSLEETLNPDEASVFEVGNYTKVGGQYTFSLSVDGNKISLTKDGVIKSDAATTTEASKTVTTLITDKNKLSELKKILRFFDERYGYQRGFGYTRRGDDG